jgi:hypothetical protein
MDISKEKVKVKFKKIYMNVFRKVMICVDQMKKNGFLIGK